MFMCPSAAPSHHTKGRRVFDRTHFLGLVVPAADDHVAFTGRSDMKLKSRFVPESVFGHTSWVQWNLPPTTRSFSLSALM